LLHTLFFRSWSLPSAPLFRPLLKDRNRKPSSGSFASREKEGRVATTFHLSTTKRARS
jgi:hypothetical protein